MQRLLSVTIVSVFNVVSGFLGGMLTGFNAVFMARLVYTAVVDRRIGPPAIINAWSLCVVVLGFVASVLLMVAGVGTLKMRPWGRRLTIVFSISASLLAVCLAVISVHFVAPALVRMQAGPLPAALVDTWREAVWYIVIWSAYPCFLLVFMYRPRVRAVFKGGMVDEKN